MKLNPPETAPKDEAIILARFRGYRDLLPAAWNGWSWTTAQLDEGYTNGEERHLYFVAEDLAPDSLLGWLPFPAIDDEGNVT